MNSTFRMRQTITIDYIYLRTHITLLRFSMPTFNLDKNLYYELFKRQKPNKRQDEFKKANFLLLPNATHKR